VYVCGGSLIDGQHIATAAHCIKGYAPGDLRVRLGEWDVNHDTEFYTHVEKDVVAVVIHPEFYAGSLYNDIAILRLDSYVDFNRK
jgi:secreted trypsin-like serine protease